MELFISYARADKPQAAALADQLKQAGNVVWLDSDLRVGQAWWDKILERIRSCDAVVVGVSRAGLKSVACRREREYAMQLGKSILPLTFEPMNTVPLPADIARLQAYDYSQPNANSGFVVMGALTALPVAPPLPSPLPQPPDMPPPPLADLVELLNQPQLSMHDQFAVVGQLEVALGAGAEEQERAMAMELLRQMATRPELLESVARRIDKLQVQTGGTAGGRTGTAGPGSGYPGQGPYQGQNQGQYQPPPTQNQGYQYQPPPHARKRQQPPPKRAPRPPQPTPAPNAVSAHWGMAITAAVLSFITILFCPIGIVALTSASRTGVNLKAGNQAAARKSSSLVVAMFWCSIVLWAVLIVIGVIVNANSPNNNLNQPSGLATASHVIVR